MPASSRPRPWPVGEALDLPDYYRFGGAQRSTEHFLTETDTAALLVLKDGRLRFEQYWLTGGPDAPWLSMSLAKSFVSALVGIALAEGHIPSLDTPVSDIVPVQAGSAYDGVSVRDTLRMSSGARWNEDYNDPVSEVYRLGRALSPGGSLDAFVASMVRENEPGTVSHYNSGETQVLGALVARATGRTLSDYMTEKLVEPLGMTSPGHWLIDPAGTELAFNGLNLTARDYARIGELYRNGGVVGDTRVLPEDWVRESVTIAAPHLEPGRVLVAGHPFGVGYGYQWWIPDGDRGEFSAVGCLQPVRLHRSDERHHDRQALRQPPVRHLTRRGHQPRDGDHRVPAGHRPPRRLITAFRPGPRNRCDPEPPGQNGPRGVSERKLAVAADPDHGPVGVRVLTRFSYSRRALRWAGTAAVPSRGWQRSRSWRWTAGTVVMRKV